MAPRKKKATVFHPRNIHQGRYDMTALVAAYPPLAAHIIKTIGEGQSINFFDSVAVQALNTALLIKYYDISQYSLPSGSLCPPIPGRAEYIHHLADVIYAGSVPTTKTSKSPRILDIGTGANMIYPIIGIASYGWLFVGSDISTKALHHAQGLIDDNQLAGVSLRHQPNKDLILTDIIGADEYFEAVMCNPPYYSSAEEAKAATTRKNQNLGHSSTNHRNFGGADHELWTAGGELAFIKKMIVESSQLQTSCLWYTSLVSSKQNLIALEQALTAVQAAKVQVIPLQHGNKISHVLCWTYLNDKGRQAWRQYRF